MFYLSYYTTEQRYNRYGHKAPKYGLLLRFKLIDLKRLRRELDFTFL